MKVETPQILWHNGSANDNGKNAPILSLSLLESGLHEDCIVRNGIVTKDRKEGSSRSLLYGHVLATASNTGEVNLWRITFRNDEDGNNQDGGASNTKTTDAGMVDGDKRTAKPNTANAIFQQSGPSTTIEYILSLTRHERSVNVVSFSPDGLHLATAGDGGSIVVYSVPPSKRGNDNGKHYWSTAMTKENDLNCRVITGQCEDIMDVSWSADSKRFLVGSLDHTILVYQEVPIGSSSGGTAAPASAAGEKWKCVYRNGRDHTQYVQGVSYDPLGVYVSSMGSDRTVRVYARKGPSSLSSSLSSAQSKKKSGAGVLKSSSNASVTDGELKRTSDEEEEERRRAEIQRVLTESKFELGKAKTLKYRQIASAPASAGDADITECNVNKDNTNGTTPNQVSSTGSGTTSNTRHHLFADESTVESFFRRLSWTTDGAYLIAPAALWHGKDATTKSEGDFGGATVTSPTFATYLFARHRFDSPHRVLPGLEKPSVVVRSNPVLFKLPKSAISSTKENKTPKAPSTLDPEENGNSVAESTPLPYRSIFAVLTLDTVLLYDTYHLRPLCIARGLHYAGLTDCAWSADGLNLLVSSTDGYVSILSFRQGELGEVYERPVVKELDVKNRGIIPVAGTSPNGTYKIDCPNALGPSNLNGRTLLPLPTEHALIPPCEPGQTATIVVPPAKRAKTTDTAPSTLSIAFSNTAQARNKEKKRIAPTLVQSGSGVVADKSTISSTENTADKPAAKIKEMAEVTKMKISGAKRVIEFNESPEQDDSEEQNDPTGKAVNDCVRTKSSENTTKDNEAETEVVGAVTKLSLESNGKMMQEQPKKKKKRIQPTLVSIVD